MNPQMQKPDPEETPIEKTANTSPSLSMFTEFTIEAVRFLEEEAGPSFLQAFNGNVSELSKDWKERTSYRTRADLEINELLEKWYEENFENYNFYSEEDTDIHTGNSRTIIVDPIDGTIPFTAGLPSCGVSIALVENGEAVASLSYFPALSGGELYIAESGKGAYVKRGASLERIYTSNETDRNKALIVLDPGKADRQAILPLTNRLLNEDGICFNPNYACASYAFSLIATGKHHGFIGMNVAPEDAVPGILLAKEAGARVTTLDSSKDWSVGDKAVVAISNPILHEDICTFGNISDFIEQE